ncbi:MAG: S8 family serine peptidase [Ginsengibacter sp.]
MKKITLHALLLFALMTGCKKDINPNQSTISTESSDKAASANINSNYVANEVLLKFKSGVANDLKTKIIALANGSISERLLTKAMQHAGDNEGIYLLRVPGNVQDAITNFKSVKEVVYAEPNYIYQHNVLSNDTYFTTGKLWGMYGDASSPANQYGSQAAEAWAVGHTGSSSVFVGVIDEGAMYAHEDLAGNVWTNPFDPIDGIDNDGNGYKDDIHGWDFNGNNNTTFDGTQDDHGTHVSGTIGAVGGNGKGVAGVNWSVTIISAKFLGNSGGTTANAIKAVDYITDLKTRHSLHLVATNNSWGGGGFSRSLKNAIERANAQNILFVAAAGNDGKNNDNTPHYPSSYTNSNVIAVASITKTGALSSFSDYGVASVDLGAPGSGIFSTLPGINNTSKYGSYDGTSMATPHVTGAAALYASTHPTATAADIKAAILNSVIATASLNGKCVTAGRLNVSGF